LPQSEIELHTQVSLHILNKNASTLHYLKSAENCALLFFLARLPAELALPPPPLATVVDATACGRVIPPS
jgi:hypothetical protein